MVLGMVLRYTQAWQGENIPFLIDHVTEFFRLHLDRTIECYGGWVGFRGCNCQVHLQIVLYL